MKYLNCDDLKSSPITILIIIEVNCTICYISVVSGTNVWVQKLKWDSLNDFNGAERIPLMSPVDQQTNSFVKTHKGLTYYYIMRAGHMVRYCFYTCILIKVYENIVKMQGRRTDFGIGGGKKNIARRSRATIFLITLFSKGYNFIH